MPAARFAPFPLALVVALLALLPRSAAAQLAPDYPSGGGKPAPAPDERVAVAPGHGQDVMGFVSLIRFGSERRFALIARRAVRAQSLASTSKRKSGR